MTLREIFFSLGYKVDKNSEKKAEKSIDNLKSMASKALGAIGIGLSVTGLSNLAQTAADLKASASQFNQVFDGVGKEAEKSLQEVSAYAGALPNRMKGSFTQMAAFAKTTGMETSDALTMTDRAMRAVADSAAFYDRSLEDTAESLRSLMKGNYENDAALGLSVTETTRNAAANALYGKSFKDLSEAQKQLTLLQMVEDANKASGALGQAAKESGEWTNQVGNLRQHLTNMKAAFGKFLLKPMLAGVKVAGEFFGKVTDKLNALSSKAEEKSNVINRKMKEMGAFLTSVGDKVNKVAKFFGGWGNLLKVLTISVAAFMVAMKWNSIVGGIKAVSSALNPATLKILAIVAVVVLLAAIVDDFINFMKGNDSVIGSLFEKAGIDAEQMRKKIVDVFQKIKAVGNSLCSKLKGEIIMLFTALQMFWQRWGPTIIQYFTDFWRMLISLIGPFITALNGLLMFLDGVFSGDWKKAFEGLKQFLKGWAQFILNLVLGLLTMWKNLALNLFGPILEQIKAGFQNVKAWFLGLPDMAKQWMHDFISGLVTGIQEKMGEFTDAVEGIGEKIKSFLHFSVPDEGPLTDYESWMPDFMTGLAQGIRNNMPLIKNAVKDAADMMAAMGGVSLNGKTALNAVGGNSKTNNVTQHNEYNIKVSGTDPQAVNKAADTLRDAGGDTTGSLADALAYG